MRFKKVGVLLLAFILVITTVVGCKAGGAKEASSDSKKTLKILTNVTGGKTPEEHELFVKELEGHLGVKIEMTKPSADYDKKLLTALSSGEKYDLIYSTTPDMNVLIEQDALLDLTQHIGKSTSLSHENIIPGSEWDLIKTKDGKIYGVPNKFEGGTMPTVRGDWLEEFGIGTPVTLDDWYTYFNIAKEKYGAYGISTAGLYEIQSFMSAEGVKAGYTVEGGKRIIPYATEKAIPIYEWFAKLHQEGLLDPNFVTNGSGEFRELFLTDKCAAVTYWDMWVGLFNNIKLQDDADTKFRAVGVAGVPGADGKIIMRRGDSSLWLVPANAENVDLAMKFLEFWHSEPGYILGTLGIKGYDYTIESNQYVLTEIGNEHSMDHGSPRVSNPNWENPIGELPGVKEAQNIIIEHATPEYLPSEWQDAEPIIEKWAFQAMKGEISGSEAVNNMQKELKSNNLID